MKPFPIDPLLQGSKVQALKRMLNKPTTPTAANTEIYPYPAPEGKVWVCTACGKQSHDRAGTRPISYGWDESCFLNAVLVDKVGI